jgi:hypothetical protein
VQRDMLLAADIIRLLQRAGLDAPFIESDEVFVGGLLDHRAGEHVTINPGDHSRLPLASMICIGLWANKITEALARASIGAAPFELIRTPKQHFALHPAADDVAEAPLRVLRIESITTRAMSSALKVTR